MERMPNQSRAAERGPGSVLVIAPHHFYQWGHPLMLGVRHEAQQAVVEHRLK